MNIGDGGSFKSLFRQIQEKGISKSTFSQFLSSQIKEAVPGIVQQGTIILQNHSQGSIRLFLNPESLGTVKIDLKISENHVTGNIKVFSSEAFEAIKDNLESLKAGFIAGGALMGVVSAAMRFGGINLVNEAWLENPLSQVVSLVAYVLLIVYLVKASMNIKKS